MQHAQAPRSPRPATDRRTRTRLRLLGGICSLLLGLAFPAAGDLGLHGSVRVSSDDLHASYSKSSDHASVQANLDYLAGSGLYAGAWLSTIDFGGAAVEGIVYAGGQRRLAPGWTADLALAGYVYDQRVFGRRADYAELNASVQYRDLATLSYSLAPDIYGLGHPVSNVGLQLGWPLSDVLRIVGGVGYQWAGSAYYYDNLLWRAGLVWALGRHWTLDLAYRGNHELHERAHAEPPAGSVADAAYVRRAVLAISYGF